MRISNEQTASTVCGHVCNPIVRRRKKREESKTRTNRRNAITKSTQTSVQKYRYLPKNSWLDGDLPATTFTWTKMMGCKNKTVCAINFPGEQFHFFLSFGFCLSIFFFFFFFSFAHTTECYRSYLFILLFFVGVVCRLQIPWFPDSMRLHGVCVCVYVHFLSACRTHVVSKQNVSVKKNSKKLPANILYSTRKTWSILIYCKV